MLLSGLLVTGVSAQWGDNNRLDSARLANAQHDSARGLPAFELTFEGGAGEASKGEDKEKDEEKEKGRGKGKRQGRRSRRRRGG